MTPGLLAVGVLYGAAVMILAGMAASLGINPGAVYLAGGYLAGVQAERRISRG